MRTSIYSKYIVLIALLFSCLGSEIWAQDVIPTKGKDFWMGFMQNYLTDSQESLDLFITSDQNTTGTVTVPGQGWEATFNVTADQTTTVTIPNSVAEHFQTSEIVEARGVHIETEDTVAVFAISFNPYTADGTKILPKKSIGTRYRVSSYEGLGGYPSEFLVVATEDGTEVTITPSVNTINGNPAGVPFTVQLDQGESYQVQSAGGDFTGSTIEGTEASGDCRPFAVFSGVVCVNIPIGCTACDHIFEQAFPTDTWGTEFYLVPFATTSGCTYRIMADFDGTQVTVNGGAPVLLDAGEFVEVNNVNEGTCFQSNQPISVIQYMQGQGCAITGDPAMLILNDESQKIDNITFSTVESTVITSHNLNVVIESVDIGSLTLDGALVDPAIFTPFPTCPDHSWAQINLTEGSHTMIAPNGFSAYVYGTGQAESYAYSVGSFSSTPLSEVDEVVCAADSVYLSIEGDLDDVIWYPQSDPENIIGTGPELTLYAPITSDIYVAYGNQFVSGCPIEELFSVEVPEPPVISAFPENPTICKYQEVQLNISATPFSPTYVYNWTPSLGLSNPNISNPIASPLVTTEYTYSVSTPSGCGNASGTITVEVADGGISGLVAETEIEAFCLGGETQLSSEVFSVELEDDFDPGISWGIWSDISSGEAANDCGSVSGLALYFNGGGQRSATTINMDVSDGGEINFALKVGSGTFPCDNTEAGEDIILEYSTDGGGFWEEINTYFEFAYPDFTEISVPIPTDAQTASTRFRWRQLANGGPGQDNWSLDNIFIGVPDNDSFDFSWTPSAGLDETDIPDPLASPTVDTWYYVEVEDQNFGCTYTDSIFIEVGQPFSLDITPDTVLCDLQGVQLSLVPSIENDYTFEWTPNDGTVSNTTVAEPIVTPTETTTYNVYVESDEGCSGAADVTITVNQLLDLNVTTDNNDFCAGEVANLNAIVDGNTDELEYEWSPATFLDDPLIADPQSSATEPVTYEVTVTDTQSGCVLTETIDINAFEAFTIQATADTAVCVVDGLQLNAVASTENPIDWSWTPAASLDNPNTDDPTAIVNASEQFIVIGTDDGGCSATDTVNVELLFESFDLGPDIDLCVGDEAVLLTGYDANFEHLWSTDETTTEITVSTGGNYSVTVSSPEGCESTDALNVVMHELPVIDLGPEPDLCEGENYVIDAGNVGADFVWSTEETTQAILVTTSNIYTVEVTDFWDCVSEASINVEFHPNPVINLPESSISCIDEDLELDAGPDGEIYDWSSGEDTRYITATETGEYIVVVTNEFNCSSIDTTVYTQVDYPALELGSDQAFCADESTVLNAGNPTETILWSTGETTPTIDVNTTGVYSVSVSNGYCVSVDQVSIFVYPLPNDPLPNDTSICTLDSSVGGQLDAENPGCTYLWSDGSINRYLTELSSATYWVEITTPFGCSYTDTINVIDFCPNDQIYIPNAFTPNEDGLNEAFYAVGPNIVAFEMKIFNRWGQEIFESDDIKKAWIGNVKGGDHFAEPGVYVYVVRYKYQLDGYGTPSDWVDKRGHVTLVR